MGQVTRRNLLGLMPGAGLAGIFSSELACAAMLGPKAVEFIVVGPLRLGEWFKRANGERFLVWGDEVGPNMKTAVATLNASPLYIIDVRDISDPKNPRFADNSEFPTLVAAKQATLGLEKDGTKCRLSLGEMSVGVDSTNGQPPIRRVRVAVQLELIKYKGSLVGRESTGAFSDSVAYDVKGKLLLANQKQ